MILWYNQQRKLKKHFNGNPHFLGEKNYRNSLKINRIIPRNMNVTRKKITR